MQDKLMKYWESVESKAIDLFGTLDIDLVLIAVAFFFVPFATFFGVVGYLLAGVWGAVVGVWFGTLFGTIEKKGGE